MKNLITTIIHPLKAPVLSIVTGLITRSFKLFKYAFILSLLALFFFIIADQCFPVPKNNRVFSAIVVAENGAPLRAFADKKGVWRYPVNIKDVSPRYLEALLGYEDRWFYYHPGVNPLALIRATGQLIFYRRLISGGSTITMQVARLLDPHSKTLKGKLKQMFRALQLEWHYSKDEILTIYLNTAPFGGPIEGVQAASYSYLGKPAKQLSYAEAALLAVLPQSPSRFRPDRHSQRATYARNKILKRLAHFNVWSQENVNDAFMEQVPSHFFPKPNIAPLLSRRLKSQALIDGIYKTTIEYELQNTLEGLLQNYIGQFPQNTSAAVLIVENDSLEVKAYLGSADFNNNHRFGHVDMVKGQRSPGSTLKPFLYAIAMDEGLIHSESLLADVPQSFDGYKPGNFSGQINGPVSVTEALQKSLNIPAVFVLDKLSPHLFSNRLRNSGLALKIPGSHTPNLTMILGGAATNLESLVSAYTMFGRKGIAGKLRYSTNSPLFERRIISEDAAWIIKNILENTPRPGIINDSLIQHGSRKVAWKTGTSYGFRDAWAIGVTANHTIGVWLGRPDNTPSPGQYGAVTAAPLLFDIIDSQLLTTQWQSSSNKPQNVSKIDICWPLGTAYNPNDDNLCHQHRKAWIINNNIPPTIPTDKNGSSLKTKIWINPKTGKLANRTCNIEDLISKEIALWPTRVEPWINSRLLNKSEIPALDPSCNNSPQINNSILKIKGLEPDTIIKAPTNLTDMPFAAFSASGGKGTMYWIINEKLLKTTQNDESFIYHFTKKGTNSIAVIDDLGNHDRIIINVID